MNGLIQLQPRDEHNRRLERNVRPPDWVNPEPEGRYNLLVIGGGTAGLVSAAGAAGLGAKVALVERELLGGDCLNVGCVPSKGLLSSARVAGLVRQASEFGVRASGDEVDFGAVMERMRRLRAGISPHDSAERFKGLGIDVYFGEARFAGRDSVEVDGRTLRFARAVIATGGRAAAPPIPGLEEIDYLTNESVFSLTELPRRLAVVGAGPIGCELAQAFARFGSEVLLVEALHGILPKEDREAAGVVLEALERDGVELRCCGKELEMSRTEDGRARLVVDSHGRHYDEVVDRVIIAAGRKPNVESLDLEAAGVEYTKKGVTVNDRLRTSNRNIYAAGDICSPYQFTHAADFMARQVIQNALFLGRAKVSALVIPWCTYTEPELARVGLSPEEAEERGVAIDVFTQPFEQVDRSVLEGAPEGFVRVQTVKGKDRILGATVVGSDAGEMISHISLAMTQGLGLKALGSTIFPYPTRAEAVRKLGDQYNRTRLTPFVKRLFERWLAWRR